MKTVNIALIWDFLFEGGLTTTGQHIRGSLIKDETNNIVGDSVSRKDNLVPFQIIFLEVLVRNAL